MVTSIDVAKLAGVSQATVSRVLNSREGITKVSEATRQRVIDAVKELGYHVNISAKSLVSNKSYSIGFAMADVSYLRNTPFAIVAGGISIIVGVKDYNLHLCTTSDKFSKAPNLNFIKKAYERALDGIIIKDHIVTDEEILNVRDFGVPVVLIDRDIPGTDIPVVSANFSEARSKIAAYFIELGHKSIAYLTPEGTADWYKTTEELDGFNMVLSNTPNVKFGVITTNKSFSNLKRSIFTGDCPTAIACSDDTIAMNLIHKLNSFGIRVPEDISVTGYEDDPMSSIHNPGITTISVPLEKSGEEAARLLFKIIENKPVKNPKIKLPVELVIRNSTGPVNPARK